MSSTKDSPKFCVQVEVTSAFAACYFKASKGQQKFSELLQGFNVVIRIEEKVADPNKAIVSICADSKENVEKAKMKILQALFHLNNRSSFTHLVTIPFTNQSFISSYLQFKEKVLSTFAECQGIGESLFQNPKKLHLTVSVLTLVSEDNIVQAKDILEKECRKILESELDFDKKLRIKGIATMNDNPSQTNVLYASVEDNRLQEVANKVAQQMVSDGLVFKDPHQSQPVKLHITLMNTVFARRKALKARKQKLNVNFIKHFDCGSILDHYKDFIFADIDMPCIQLNDISSENEHGYYKVIHSIPLINTNILTNQSIS